MSPWGFSGGGAVSVGAGVTAARGLHDDGARHLRVEGAVVGERAAALNVTDADAPSAMLPVSKEPPSAVAVWATPLVLSQVTVSPTLTVVVGG